MVDVLPNPEQLRAMMVGMNYAAMERLASVSGVPFHTIRKIRDGETRDPGLNTAHMLWPHLRLIAEARPS